MIDVEPKRARKTIFFVEEIARRDEIEERLFRGVIRPRGIRPPSEPSAESAIVFLDELRACLRARVRK